MPTSKSATTPGDLTQEQRSRAKKAVAAASIGNALEWYDIMIYGYFAAVISKLFFPSESEFVGLLLTFGTFAISYLIRPIGAMVIGNIGDRRGRKTALNLTIQIMFVGTLLLTFAPTHSHIGPAAAVLVLIARLLQGFSAGGEFGSATTFLTESAVGRKAYYASWQTATQGGSLLLAATVSFILTATLATTQLDSWGWRVAFGVGLMIGPVGLYIRARIDDTPEFADAEILKSPLRTTLGKNLSRVLTAAGCVGAATITMYLLLYMPTFAIRNLGLPTYSGYIGGIIGGLTVLVCSPQIGKLADRFGCVTVMRPAAVVGMLGGAPLFWLLQQAPTVAALTLVQAVLGVILAFYFAPLPALMSYLFPTAIRTTGISVAYNIGVLLFGGTAPVVFAALVEFTGSLVSPSYFYIAVCGASVIALELARRRFAQN
ncbi:MFS transporter [Mycolicibacterium baixiangningiae]|uniref:MFS transporter n=1 Tax=Mycolicibacterium baixiangningiae TaxID=2761578 RepID=UPI0018676DCC|nr:MFS transporter [Mycolicibacterium baixiangningiae]